MITDVEPTADDQKPQDTADNSFSAIAADVMASPRKRVHDPCCGSGRMLLAAAQINRHGEFVGQDVDLRCVRMAALNLAFRNLYGYVIWGNTLAMEQKLVYRTGFDGIGFLREVALESCPAPVQHEGASSPVENATIDDDTASEQQLRLF